MKKQYTLYSLLHVCHSNSWQYQWSWLFLVVNNLPILFIKAIEWQINRFNTYCRTIWCGCCLRGQTSSWPLPPWSASPEREVPQAFSLNCYKKNNKVVCAAINNSWCIYHILHLRLFKTKICTLVLVFPMSLFLSLSMTTMKDKTVGYFIIYDRKFGKHCSML